MPQDILAHGNADNGNVDAARGGMDVKKSASPAEKDKRFRLPVGVALGLVFSVLLVVICGIIIT